MPKPERIPFVLFSFLYGEIARWATRQSPYHAPEGMVEVLTQFQKNLVKRESENNPHEFPYPGFIRADKKTLLHVLKVELLIIPQVQAWNERKNGNNSPFGFCSRYDKPNPDDDFIDLDALIWNIARSCIQHDHESREQDRPRRWWEINWWYRLKLKLQLRSVVPCCPETPLNQKSDAR